MPPIKAPRVVRWYVYRMDYKSMGQLEERPKYVGFTNNPRKREGKHQTSKFGGCDMTIISEHDTQEEAMRAEDAAILSLNPVHNVKRARRENGHW